MDCAAALQWQLWQWQQDAVWARAGAAVPAAVAAATAAAARAECLRVADAIIIHGQGRRVFHLISLQNWPES